jgi:hypothetical protein
MVRVHVREIGIPLEITVIAGYFCNTVAYEIPYTFFFLYIFLLVFVYIFVPLPPLRGQHTVLCHPRWLPTSGLAEFAMCWGGAGFEPRTTDLQSGALPLSHLSSRTVPPTVYYYGIYIYCTYEIYLIYFYRALQFLSIDCTVVINT